MSKKIQWINAIFATAMVMNCSLAKAADEINAPIDELKNAYKFMTSVLTASSTPLEWVKDYQLGVTECFKKLEAAN